jgi:C1A family cysteine protease
VPEVELKEIRSEITKNKAGWKAADHPLLKLSGAQRTRRLGVIPDERRLAELRERPKPNMAEVVAEFRGLRLEGDGDGAGTRTGRAATRRAEGLELDERIIETIRQQIRTLPAKVDWRARRRRNNVTPIKDQGGCGSCVSFGTTATLESMVLIEHNMAFDLSEAELLFCGGGGCAGWWPDSAVTYLLNKGIAHETCFPYQDHDMPCTTCSGRNGEAIRIRNHVTTFDTAQRKRYLAHVGPVMAVFAVYNDFFAYSSGVYRHVAGALAGYHCVSVIGYDDTQQCWISKNSWGAGWGDNGFFRIGYGECDIDSTYPFWGIGRTQWYA